MKKKIAAAMLAVMMVGCLILSGCSGDKDDKKDGATGESVSVKISAINAVSWAPLFIAESEGFLRKRDWTLNLQLREALRAFRPCMQETAILPCFLRSRFS